jgi:hypothetical protein
MNWKTSNIEHRTLNVEGSCPGNLKLLTPVLFSLGAGSSALLWFRRLTRVADGFGGLDL